MPAELKPLGPLPTTVRGAARTLDELWGQTDIETRAYTGNIVALTVPQHLARVEEALKGLEGRYAGRQIIGVMGPTGTGRINLDASLVPQNGLYVERLTLFASAEQMQGAILPLLRPATVNHVWWATTEPPNGPLMRELGDIADQIIADTLRIDLPPRSYYALADLSWSRSAAWREALAQIFDSKDAAAALRSVNHLTIWTAERNYRAALLFAGWVASTLGWKNLDAVTFVPHQCQRALSDLCGVQLSGPDGLSFTLEAQGAEAAQATVNFGKVSRQTTLMVPSMTLAEGLARVMVRPERSAVFEAAWKLAHDALASGRTFPTLPEAPAAHEVQL